MSIADLLVPNPYPLNLGPLSVASLSINPTPAQNLAATTALVQASPDPLVYSMPLAAGTFTPTWTSFAGISGDPGILSLHWMRVGNTVTCSLTALGAVLTGGQIVAQVTVPIPSQGLVNLPTAAGGSAAVQDTMQSIPIFGNTGFNNRVSLSSLNSTASAGTAIIGSFTYLVT